MKRLIYHLFGGIFAVLLLVMATGTAWAEEQSGELMVLPGQANIVVSITYETEKPNITLISPDGTTYSEAAGNVKTEQAEKTIYYYLPDALAGQWLIRYDKKSNPTITADYAEYTPDLVIESMIFKGVSEHQAELLFQVSFAKDISYNYVISAVLLDEGRNVTGRKELDHGTARTNREENRKVSLNNLSSYNNYYLELEVYYKEYNLETFDTKIADQNFGYINDNQPESLKGVKVEIDPAGQMLTMDWTDYKVYCDQYVAAVFTEENGNEPVSYQKLDSENLLVKFVIPPDTKSVTVELSYLKNGLTSLPYRRQINWENGMKLSINTEENTNSVQALITYETDVPRNAVVHVNGEEQNIALEGKGDFSVQLEEYSNELSVKCVLDEMTDVIYRKSVYSDRIAPVLKFYENVDAIHVAENHFLLTGETENGCTLTINGTEYPLGNNGSFSAELSLSKEENIFEVISRDPAGNQSLQNITIYHGTDPAAIAASSNGTNVKGGDYLPLLLSLAAGMMIVLTVIVTNAVLQRKAGLPKGVLLTATLRNVFLLLSLFGITASAITGFMTVKSRQDSKSMAFIQAAERSPQDAFELLREQEEFRDLFLIILAATIACLLVTIILTVIKSKLKNKKMALNEASPEMIDNAEEAKIENEMQDETKDEIEASDDDEPKYCIHCGEKINKEGATFCPKCGGRLKS